jgi:hypothetical protein
MTVYVDDAQLRRHGRAWSHLVADTAEELHRAAWALGVPREAAQNRGRTLHYDLPESLRRRAIELAIAEPISWQELVLRRATMAPGDRASGRRSNVAGAGAQSSAIPGDAEGERL